MVLLSRAVQSIPEKNMLLVRAENCRVDIFMRLWYLSWKSSGMVRRRLQLFYIKFDAQ
jgi:hypothetical protein